MTTFLSELGKRVAERWLTVLVLPGVLLLATGSVAWVLGHGHAVDAARYADWLGERVKSLQADGAVAIAVAAVVLLLGSVGLGLLADTVAVAVRQMWLGPWPRLLSWWGARRTRSRAARWDRLSEEYEAAVLAGDTAAADRVAARNSISLARPSRPTWMGDRIVAVESRVYDEYGLDLGFAWPRLWMLLAADDRDELRAARGMFDRSSIQAAWGVLCAVIGLVWWPALPIACAALLLARQRGRGSMAVLADLVESVVDLQGPALAQSLEASDTKLVLTPELGRRITVRLRKGA